MRPSFAVTTAMLVVSAWLAAMPVQAAPFFASPAFQQQWQQGEAIVSNFWGPLAIARDGQLEPYLEGLGSPVCPPPPAAACSDALIKGRRLVQYFDKARMEQTKPGSSVTNGLLTVELLSGNVQTGDTTFEQRQPATIPVAGDPGNVFPTYADLRSLTAKVAQDAAPVSLLLKPGAPAAQYAAGASDPLAAVNDYDSVTGHRVPKAFADFRTRAGVPAVGLAVTEPFWAAVTVAGTVRTVMAQGFERRVLTYTPSNPDPFKVEFGNIGQHYYSWRYGGSSASVTGQSAATAPLAPPTTTTAAAVARPVPAVPASGNGYICRDFPSQAKAQAYLRAYPDDPSGLDPDRSGIACKNNPGPFDLSPIKRT